MPGYKVSQPWQGTQTGFIITDITVLLSGSDPRWGSLCSVSRTYFTLNEIINSTTSNETHLSKKKLVNSIQWRATWLLRQCLTQKGGQYIMQWNWKRDSERGFEIKARLGLSYSKVLKWLRKNIFFISMCTILKWILCAFSTLI